VEFLHLLQHLSHRIISVGRIVIYADDSVPEFTVIY
jgi:hypothetical protein